VWVGGVKPSVLLVHRLSRLTTPTLLVWGEEDRVFPVRHARRAARLLPRAHLYVIPRCGHWPHVERPGEFLQAVEAFLGDDRPPAADR